MPICHRPTNWGRKKKTHFPAHLLHLSPPLLADFPRLEQWSESPSPSDASLFMDGFLYISAAPAKTSLDRRGRDGEQCGAEFIRQSICKQFTLACFVRDPLQLSAERSISVTLVSCQAANRLIRTPNGAVETINGTVFRRPPGSARHTDVPGPDCALREEEPRGLNGGPGSQI